MQLLASTLRSGVARWRPAVASLAVCPCGARRDPGPQGRRCSGTTRSEQSSDESPSLGCPPVGPQMSLTTTSDVMVPGASHPAAIQTCLRTAEFGPKSTKPCAFAGPREHSPGSLPQCLLQLRTPHLPRTPRANCRRPEAVASKVGLFPEFSGARLVKTLVHLGSPRASSPKRSGSACGLSGLLVTDWELGSACGFSGLPVGMFSSRRGSACGVSGLPVSRWDPVSACGHSGLPIGIPVMIDRSWHTVGR